MSRPLRIAVCAALAAAAVGLAPALALAAEAKKLDPGNTAWMLTATALVLFMTIPGLSLFYGGLVRAKNILSLLMQCFAITCLVSILWLAYGYSLAFSDGGGANALIGGLGKAFFKGVGVDALQENIPETLFAMFQLTFAIITPALIVGGFAERMKFSALLLFSALWLTLVYVPVAHWVWGGGWLAGMGALDFAGGTVVHINSGVSALVAALVMGPRRGFPETPMIPHNLPLTVAGAAMLWVGWFGFNAGSALAANGTAGMAMTVTHMSAAAAALTWMTCEWFRYGKPSVLGIATGAVAGLVAITPASGTVGPMGGLLLGVAAGFVCFSATTYMKQVLKVDDSLDVFPVHGVGGFLGAVLTGVFTAKGLGGVGFAEGMTMGKQVWVQIIAAVATLVYAAVVSFILLKIVDAVAGLRVPANEEVEGLDLALHNETGYELR
ncbi:MAG: ammonium transporter [Nitrospinota bacterium]